MRALRIAAVLAFVAAGVTVTAQSAMGDFGSAAAKYVRYFDDKGPRAAGQQSERNAADYIASELQAMGYTPQRQRFSETVEKKKQCITVSSENIICVKEGSDPREILLSAHYDSVTAGNGSDDNASGVAVLLETCRRVRELPIRYTVRFVFFGAEELGEVGSKFYVRTASKEVLGRTLVVVNYDSLIAGDKLYVHGSLGGRGVVRDWFMAKANALGIGLYRQNGKNADYPAGTTGDWGDQAPFDKAGIQYAAFEATNWDLGDLDGYTQTDIKYGEKGQVWHTKYDTLQ